MCHAEFWVVFFFVVFFAFCFFKFCVPSAEENKAFSGGQRQTWWHLLLFHMRIYASWLEDGCPRPLKSGPTLLFSCTAAVALRFPPVEWKAVAPVKWRWIAVEMLWYRLQQTKRNTNHFDSSSCFAASSAHIYQYQNLASLEEHENIFFSISFFFTAVELFDSRILKCAQNIPAEYVYSPTVWVQRCNSALWVYEDLNWHCLTYFKSCLRDGCRKWIGEWRLKNGDAWYCYFIFQRYAVISKLTLHLPPFVALFQNAVRLI